MKNQKCDAFGRSLLAACSIAALLLPCLATADEADSESVSVPRQSQTHMSEVHRSSVSRIVVLPTAQPADQAVTGSYEKQTKGLIGGIDSGRRLGDGVSRDIGGVRVGFPIPILTLPGALFGGIKGKAKREIQEFRDALTEDLANAAGQPLSNDALASDVFWGLRNVPTLDSKVLNLTTPIPDDAEAILYVSLTELTINVEGKDAVITTSADATLHRLSDGRNLYSRHVEYQDRDTLGNWTRDDNALWRDYYNFARHYIGREISAETFERVALRRELHPAKNKWRSEKQSSTPTLAWELKLSGGDAYGAWANELNDADMSYDVEIYDMHRLVYSAKRVAVASHTVEVELEPCNTYRWSVRPAYDVNGETKFGPWMRSAADAESGNGNIGRKVSEAPAYTQDFALLKTKCGRK